MTVEGEFDVALSPREDVEAPVSRLIMDKTYHGEMEGKGTGQMISKRLENGTAAYFAIEEFSGNMDGKAGGFTLLHRGFMDAESQTLDITILDGSGGGELSSISGSMGITMKDGKHYYKLDYEL